MCEMETGRRDFVGDWVLKDGVIRHRTTTYSTVRMVQNILRIVGHNRSRKDMYTSKHVY
jgi:hypothetical protein